MLLPGLHRRTGAPEVMLPYDGSNIDAVTEETFHA